MSGLEAPSGTNRCRKSDTGALPLSAFLRPGIRILRRVAALAVERGLQLFVLLLAPLAAALSRRRLLRGQAASVWGITPILTLRTKSRADRLLGTDARSLVFTTYRMTRDFDLVLANLAESVHRRAPGFYRAFHYAVLAYALVRFDIFHYYCDRGILLPAVRIGIHPFELRILRAAGKRLYTYTYGADVRTRDATIDLGRYNFCVDCTDVGKACICDTAEGERNVARIASFATAMLAMGDMKAYVPGARDFHYWPLDLAHIPFIGVPTSAARPLRIVHAPNHPQFKGTRHLLAVVERLRSAGVSIELDLVQGLSNEEALLRYEQASIVAEQFIGGFHGYTALEAMAMGKPVVAYIRDPADLIAPGDCPIVSADPDSLYDVLTSLLRDPEKLHDLGRRGRDYVRRYYSVEAFAVRLGRLYLETGRFPPAVQRRLIRAVSRIEASVGAGTP